MIDKLPPPHREFESDLRKFLRGLWGVELAERSVLIGAVTKKFDLVSEDKAYVGDAKYLKNNLVPAAKFSTIAEYVWLLSKTQAKHKFLVFGNDRELPEHWLKRFGSILGDVELYFFAGSDLTRLA